MEIRLDLETVMNACTYINQHFMENLTLEEVARIGGFSSMSACNRVFKMIKHCSPSSYRKIGQQTYPQEE